MIRQKGGRLTASSRVLIMVHGRGANAEDILGLAAHLPVNDFTLLAPQATNNTWYPYSFMAPPSENEPWLSSALDMLKGLVEELYSLGIPANNIFFLGFSQGACLTLESTSRNPNRYGGILAFTGGLIGDKIYSGNYQGDFNGTPVFIGTADPDAHVPVERVYDTERILNELNAEVTVKIYKGMGHTITKDEIDDAVEAVFGNR